MKKQPAVLLCLFSVLLACCAVLYGEFSYARAVRHCVVLSGTPLTQEMVQGAVLNGDGMLSFTADAAVLRLPLPQNQLVRSLKLQFPGSAPASVSVQYRGRALMSPYRAQNGPVTDGAALWQQQPVEMGELSVHIPRPADGEPMQQPEVILNTGVPGYQMNVPQVLGAALLGSVLLIGLAFLFLVTKRRHPLVLLLLSGGLFLCGVRAVYSCGLQPVTVAFFAVEALLLGLVATITGGRHETEIAA